MLALLEVVTFIANQIHIIRKSLHNRFVIFYLKSSINFFTREFNLKADLEWCAFTHTSFKQTDVNILNGVNHLRSVMRLIAELFISKVWIKCFVKIKRHVCTVCLCEREWVYVKQCIYNKSGTISIWHLLKCRRTKNCSPLNRISFGFLLSRWNE